MQKEQNKTDEKKAWHLDVIAGDGALIFGLRLYEQVRQNPTDGNERPEMKESDAPGNGAPMTDAQKRYLFRILAEQGIEGDKAHQHLKEKFQVQDLKEVTKLEASRLIERMLEENKGGSS